MKNMTFRKTVALSWKRQMDGQGERDLFDWKEVTVMIVAFVWADEFTTK